MSAKPDTQSDGYTVDIPEFAGPLDLLLRLIERAELDITKVSIAQVTDPFLAYLRNSERIAPEELSAFIVISARLIQIKSELLLPRPPVREQDEEDPGDALARQLIAYKRYKEISEILKDRESAGLRSFLRMAPPPRVEGKLDLTGIGVPDLLLVARRVFNQSTEEVSLGSVVSRPKVTIRQKIIRIIERIRSLGRVDFLEVMGSVRTRLDVVVSFLAMLELIKLRRVLASQEGQFGEISISPAEEWDDNAEFDLEFGE